MNSDEAYRSIYKTGVSILALEKIIIQNIHYAYYYAKYITHDRFKLAEPSISLSGNYSYFYGLNVIKGRFQSGELVISNSDHANCYVEDILRYDHE